MLNMSVNLNSTENTRTTANSRRTERLRLSPGEPLNSARKFAEQHFTANNTLKLRHQHGDFLRWSGSCYLAQEEAALRAAIYSFLDAAVARDPRTGRWGPFNPTKHKVDVVLDALKSHAHLAASTISPSWLVDQGEPMASEIVSCSNGLLHLPTRDLLPQTPKFFTRNALPLPYLADAPAPTEWLAFLDKVWPNDPQSIAVLQEIFGYFLTSDTRQQKLFLLVGPPRSGKGTIGRVLTELLGRHNICSPTLASLAERFGLQPLIGKSAAVIGDARLGGQANQQTIAERLLSVSGEDPMDVDRKHQLVWTGRLIARFFIISNELPPLNDASGALASRFIILRLTKSFLGKEDTGLTARLLKELPGILQWAIDGWARLAQRGRFEQPASADSHVAALNDLSSPIKMVLNDKCVIDADLHIECGRLYGAWVQWCAENGHKNTGSSARFGSHLSAVLPNIRTIRPNPGGSKQRPRCYAGIGLR
jgi:putative DNA primase/helicase